MVKPLSGESTTTVLWSIISACSTATEVAQTAPSCSQPQPAT